MQVDRLGSVRSGGPGGLGHQAEYPYGVEYTQTANDREKYATYTRDSVTGLDYAMNRYYTSQWGRFLSPDPYGGSAKSSSPQSWDRYSYAGNDSVNSVDPSGLYLYGGPPTPWGPGIYLPPLLAGGGSGNGGFGGGSPGGNGPMPCIAALGRISIDPFFRPCGSGGGSSGGRSAYRPMGYNGARLDLAKKNCYQILGFGSATAAQTRFSQVTFQSQSLGPLEVQNEPDGSLGNLSGPDYPFAATGSQQDNTITLNSDVNWADLSKVTVLNITNGQTTQENFLATWNAALAATTGIQMNTSQLTAMILLHEFEHVLGAPQENDPVAFNTPIVNNCIK